MEHTSTVPAAQHDSSFHNNGQLSAGIVQQGTGNAGRDLYNGKSFISPPFIVEFTCRTASLPAHIGSVNIYHDRSPKPLPTSTVQFRRDKDFVHRNILDDIRRLCAQPAGCAALVGLGGVG